MYNSIEVTYYTWQLLLMTQTFACRDVLVGTEGFPGLLAKEHSVRQMSDWFSTGCVGSVDSQPLDPSVQQVVDQGIADSNEDFNPFARNALSAPPKPFTQDWYRVKLLSEPLVRFE
ncbi:hypothetical protein WUBG_15239 [Wuchereria bancrofti]|uniref:Uncharacterized protein n=1 Tax=Wuchereria bancrofti TaxID=6293 RepID=J9EEI0_WUCBA|nr:hypothetical protein WUBG_15239 [Wuchereria bancrofti]